MLGNRIFRRRMLLVIQHNCRQTYAVTIAAFEAGLQLGAGLVCLQEPYVAKELQHPGFVTYWPEKGERKEQRAAIGVRRDLLTKLNFDLRTDLVSHPYVIAVDIWELDNSVWKRRIRRTRVVNCYDNWIRENRSWQGESSRRRRVLEGARREDNNGRGL
jgi:hypothetical protein